MISTKHLIISEIPPRTPKWHEFRLNGIGGSEIATVLGLPDALRYKSLARLYNEKIGASDPFTGYNEAMLSGIILEDIVATLWEYYDGTSYINNYVSNKRQRKCGIIPGYAVNPKYPYLFASIDRYIPEGEFSLEGIELPRGGILELKTAENTAVQHWSGDYPETYEYQVQQYLLVYELDYAEIAIFKNGRYLSVFPIYRDEEKIERIIRAGSAFWNNRVVPGRKAFLEAEHHKKMGDMDKAEEYMAFYQSLEPEPDGYDDYDAMMSEQMASDDTETRGDQKNYNRAVLDKMVSEVIKEFETVKKQNRQLSKKDFIKEQVTRMTFDDGYISFKETKNGIAKFDNRLKTDINTAHIKALTKILLTEL